MLADMTRRVYNTPMMKAAKRTALSACEIGAVTLEQARQWFLDLEEHPERYRFDSHAGFSFLDGGFAQVGARFSTVERFYGVVVELQYVLTDVSTDRFRFRLIRPPFPVWGEFSLHQTAPGRTTIELVLGGTNRLGAGFLRLPLVRGAIAQQIHKEVSHIKESMESAYTESAYAPED